MELSFLFMPANWNSYSKSETALKPLIIADALYFTQSSIVRLLKETTFIFFLSNFKSLKRDLFIISMRSSNEK